MLHNDNLSLLEKQPSLKTVLIVEDDNSTAEFLHLAISSETPYGVLLVTDGQEALQILKETTPDLILLDYHLPYMNGLAFYDLLHTTQGHEKIPVIFLSASTPLSVIKEIAQRNVALLEKPFELDDLLNVIHRVLT